MPQLSTTGWRRRRRGAGRGARGKSRAQYLIYSRARARAWHSPDDELINDVPGRFIPIWPGDLCMRVAWIAERKNPAFLFYPRVEGGWCGDRGAREEPVIPADRPRGLRCLICGPRWCVMRAREIYNCIFVGYTGISESPALVDAAVPGMVVAGFSGGNYFCQGLRRIAALNTGVIILILLLLLGSLKIYWKQ